jgi:hypothetical protein
MPGAKNKVNKWYKEALNYTKNNDSKNLLKLFDRLEKTAKKLFDRLEKTAKKLKSKIELDKQPTIISALEKGKITSPEQKKSALPSKGPNTQNITKQR